MLYADDELVASQNESDVQHFLSELESEFSVTSSPASCFLGLQIKQENDGSVFINQAHYTHRLLTKFNMSNCNPIATPADNSSVYADDNSNVLEGNVSYREALVSLLYSATGTRIDISFAVSVVSQVLSKSTKRH